MFQNLKGLAQVRFVTALRSVIVRDVVVVLQRFDAMRLEGIGPFGQPMFLLVSDAQQFSLYTPQEARLISGTASARNLSRLFGVALAPVALQYMLVGDVPLTTLPVAGTLAYLSRRNLYLWEGRGPESPQTYRIWFEPYQLHPVRFEVVEPSGEMTLQVHYEEFRQLNGFTLPYRVAIVQPLAGRRLVWHYTEVRINAGVSPALFRVHVPPGTRRIELE
jgi:outer membrane lipoprotein-sorting protein